MIETLRIALIGDFDPNVRAHVAIPLALDLAAQIFNSKMEPIWLPTAQLERDHRQLLANCAACWCAPGSPYRSMNGALRAIQFARESGMPFLGTCGGFQHALIEYARNVLHLAEADHAESNPSASLPLIAPLTCALVAATGTIQLRPGSQARAIFGRDEIVESFNCSYGLNASYQSRLNDGVLQISGVDTAGAARVIELTGHPFFMATLFQPELSALEGRPHPLILRFVEAALAHHSRLRVNQPLT
ncbi:MAG: hypothetical protein HY043_15655 [Verrucomicrobia bacterium]|nr:hypothetical protein [Verrucomicrobiota bacterium]